MDLQHGCFSVKMYAKTKELGPVGGRAPGTPPRSANGRRGLIGIKCHQLDPVYYNVASFEY